MPGAREVVRPPLAGLDLGRHYGHHQSPAIRAAGLVFCSGMVAVAPESGDRLHGTVTSETARIFENLRLLLAAAGSSLERIVQIRAMLYDRIEYDVMNRVYRRFASAAPPARTVWSVRLDAGFKVMLDVTALADTGRNAMSTNKEIIEPRNPALNVSRNLGLPHSPGVRVGDLIFLSGMVSTDPKTGERKHDTVAGETRQILQNMAHLLESGGSSLDKVVKLNVLLYDMLELENMNAVFREFFPVDPPARTACGVQLGFGLKVEIECIALAA